MKQWISNYLTAHKATLDSIPTAAVAALIDQVRSALKEDRQVLVFGNGGSAADAQHIAAELAGRMYLDRDSLPAIALTTNSSSVTAIANDYGYETIFAHQLRGLAVKGDVAFALSAGGTPPTWSWRSRRPDAGAPPS